jgi:hypothetical protein
VPVRRAPALTEERNAVIRDSYWGEMGKDKTSSTKSTRRKAVEIDEQIAELQRAMRSLASTSKLGIRPGQHDGMQ